MNTKLDNAPVWIIFMVIAAKTLLIPLSPIFTILALNTLFHLEIGITFWSWLSTLWLMEILDRFCKVIASRQES